MSAPHQPYHHSERPDDTHVDAPAVHWWDKQNPRGTIIAYTMTLLGLALLPALLIPTINDNPVYASFLLLCSCALVFFGSIGLLFDLADWAAKRFIRSRRYCGCCVSYQAQQGDYKLGYCAAGHSQGEIERNHFCPYFHYSERAMVRDRLWQHRYTLERIRSMKADSEQVDSDD